MHVFIGSGLIFTVKAVLFKYFLVQVWRLPLLSDGEDAVRTHLQINLAQESSP